jgi:hypothetical protein
LLLIFSEAYPAIHCKFLQTKLFLYAQKVASLGAFFRQQKLVLSLKKLFVAVWAIYNRYSIFTIQKVTIKFIIYV